MIPFFCPEIEKAGNRRRTRTVASSDAAITSRRDRLEKRNRIMTARYYYWTEIKRRRFDDVLRILSDNEFFVEERTISNTLVEQDDFLNGCLELKTLLSPEELLESIHEIEKNAGRERVIHWGPRTLDLDILLYDDLVLEREELCIPHVEMHKRKFVLEPLHEIAPYKRHPVYGKTVREMLEDCDA